MFNTTKLKNGLKLITAPTEGTRTATVLVMVGTGSRYETRENSGISHFLEHMFFKGTKKRPSTLAIASELDSFGAEFNAFTSKEYTGYYVKADAARLPSALDVVSDLLLDPLLPPAEIRREKGVIIEELNMYRDNPMYYIEDLFEALLYGDTPAGRDTIGTRENILRFKRRDFTDYLESQYGAHNTTVVLSGNIGAGGHGRLVGRYLDKPALGKRDKNFREKPAVEEKQDKPRLSVLRKKTDQAHLALGVRACSYSDPDRLAAKMLSVILGGSMSSRLFINLRERRGLAYYVHTGTEIYSDSGYLVTRAGVPVDKAGEAVDIITREYRRAARRGVEEKELNRVRDMLRGRTAIQLEQSDNTANWYARQQVLSDTLKRTGREAPDVISPDEYHKRIGKLTVEDLKRAANRIFCPENLNLAVIGDYGKKEEKEFNEILNIKK